MNFNAKTPKNTYCLVKLLHWNDINTRHSYQGSASMLSAIYCSSDEVEHQARIHREPANSKITDINL